MDNQKTEVEWLEKKVQLSKFKVLQRESDLMKARVALASDEVDLKVAIMRITALVSALPNVQAQR